MLIKIKRDCVSKRLPHVYEQLRIMLMSENKTEKPTKQRLKKAKEKGESPKSVFLVGAFVFTGSVILLWGLHDLFLNGFSASMRAGLSQQTVEGAFYRVFSPLIFPSVLSVLGMFTIALCANLLQTGWVWSFMHIKPKWGKKQGKLNFIFPILQFIVIIIFGYFALDGNINPNILFVSSQQQGAYLVKRVMNLVVEIGAFLLFLGVCDFFYQKWRYYKKMHMTPEEKKQELRESEGNPQIKRHMRQPRD